MQVTESSEPLSEEDDALCPKVTHRGARISQTPLPTGNSWRDVCFGPDCRRSVFGSRWWQATHSGPTARHRMTVRSRVQQSFGDLRHIVIDSEFDFMPISGSGAAVH